MSENKKKKPINQILVSKYIFVGSILFYPLLMFCVFYIGTNLNSILMAFQSISIRGEVSFAGLSNFSEFIKNCFGGNPYVTIGLKNSIKVYFINLVICVPLYILFSYILFKKCIGNRVIRAVVMTPSIISGFIMCLIFKNFVTMGLPEFLNGLFGVEIPNLLRDARTSLATNIFYAIWTSFATSLIVYPNAMKEIDEGIIEAGRVDGINNMFSELRHIILPLIYPTLSTFIITGFSSILTDGGVVATFYMYDAPLEVYNMGYYYWTMVANARTSGYPELAAGGLLMTAVVAPLTLLLRWFLNKHDPSSDY